MGLSAEAVVSVHAQSVGGLPQCVYIPGSPHPAARSSHDSLSFSLSPLLVSLPLSRFANTRRCKTRKGKSGAEGCWARKSKITSFSKADRAGPESKTPRRKRHGCFVHHVMKGLATRVQAAVVAGLPPPQNASATLHI